MTHIQSGFTERNTYAITVGTTFTPTSASWHWTDEDGTVINSRSSQNIAVPSTAMTIELTGADLVIADAKKTDRVFTIYGTLASGTKTFAEEARVPGTRLLNRGYST